MAIGTRYVNPYQTDIDVNGVPYVGGKLYFYTTGTATPQGTFADVLLTTANPNPVPADDNGRWPSIWLSPGSAYKVILQDKNGSQIWMGDPVGPASGGASQDISGIIGEVRAYAGIAGGIPSKWYLCYGQAVSRTDFAGAFSVMGTAWGAGDGSTTFNLPDLRGRGLAGMDAMGGVAASRMTAGVSGIAGATLGGVGGDQKPQADALSASTIVTITDPTHVHAFFADHPGPITGQAAGEKGDGYGTQNTSPASTGITASAATTVTSAFTGASGNVQPTAMVQYIIYLGA